MRLTIRRAGLLVPAVVALTTAGGLAGVASPDSGHARSAPLAAPNRAGGLPVTGTLGGATIRHVVEIMLENHTTANLFGAARASAPAGQSGLSRIGPVAAPPNEGDVQGGIDNSRAAERLAMDPRPGRGYLMDKFTTRPFGIQAVTTFGPAFDPDLQYLARAYEQAARNFQPVIGPTQPNVMMALNGTAHGWYFNAPPPRPRPWHSIFDELTAYGRSWKIYYALPRRLLLGTVWQQLLPPGHAGNLTAAGRFFTDVRTGRLPAFSFIRPGIGYSEEPREDIGEGDAWLGQLVNAVAHSRYWRSTVIFVTYDEGGGFWDPVAPTVASGYGTRTPLVIVSPWARRGVIRRTTTNLSILAFMQHLWDLPALTPLNARQWDLAGAFDFRQRPLPRPSLPVAPPDTIGFHGATDLLDVHSPLAHQWMVIRLAAETGGLTVDPAASGTVSLRWILPAGVTGGRLPLTATLTGGRAVVRARFPAPGYYRLHAGGPDGSVGWTTIFVR